MKDDVMQFSESEWRRNPGRVFEAARKHDHVVIHTDNGETFVVLQKETQNNKPLLPDFSAHAENLRNAGLRQASSDAEVERICRIIAGGK